MLLKAIRTVPAVAAGASLAIATTALADPAGFDGPETLRVYMVGNSLTDTVNYGELESMAETRGHEHIWGRDMIPGSPLSWHWDHPYDGFGDNQQSAGNADGQFPDALPNYTWDALTLQPFDRHVYSDFDYATRFVNLLKQHPGNLDAEGKVDTQVYIYSHWPHRISDGESGYDPLDFQERWDAVYTGGWDGTFRTRDYFEDLVNALNDPDSVGKEDPGTNRDTILSLPETITYGPEGSETTIDVQPVAELLNKPVRMIPAGDVIYELQNRLEAEPNALTLYGIDDVEDLYNDGTHLGDHGRFLVASTYFAVLYGEDPVGLPSEGYGDFTPEYVNLVQDTVWDVVNGHPYSGVNVAIPEPTSAAVLMGLGGLTLLRRR